MANSPIPKLPIAAGAVAFAAGTAYFMRDGGGLIIAMSEAFTIGILACALTGILAHFLTGKGPRSS